MTLEALLKCSASELEAMTDEQLTAHFESFNAFNVTRPDRESAVFKESKGETKTKKPQTLADKNQMTFRNLDAEKREKLKSLAAAQGLDLKDLFSK